MNRMWMVVVFALVAWASVGCGEKVTDPNEKIDAPGYYNGPMEPRGGNSKGGDEGKQ